MRNKDHHRNENTGKDVGLWPKNPWATVNGGSELKACFLSWNLVPLSGAMWWSVDNHNICPLPCSNYDKKYYCLQYHIPTEGSSDLEEHLYGPEDPQSLPP